MDEKAEWQLVEENIDEESPFQAEPDSDIDRDIQYFWGQRYLDDIIAHRVDETSDGTYDETYYHMTDALFSTVAILDSSADLVERLNYDSYGDVMHQTKLACIF